MKNDDISTEDLMEYIGKVTQTLAAHDSGKIKLSSKELARLRSALTGADKVVTKRFGYKLSTGDYDLADGYIRLFGWMLENPVACVAIGAGSAFMVLFVG